MNRTIEIQYCFEKTATVLDRDSEKLSKYSRHFKEEVLPEIRDIEKKKATARELAYQLRVS